MEWTGSPTKKASASFSIYDENTHSQMGLKRTSSALPLPLTTAKFVNRMGPPPKHHNMPGPVDELLAKLTNQQELLARQKRELEDAENRSSHSSATDPNANTPPTDSFSSDGRPDAAEVMRLKKELALANERMSQMDLQITQSRIVQHTMEEAIGSPFPTAQHLAASMPVHNMMSAAQSNPYARVDSPFERGSFNMPQQQQSFDSMQGLSRQYGGYNNQPKYTPPITPAPFQAPYAMPNGVGNHQLPPVGTKLSPTAAEFGVGRGQWSMQAPPAYASATEPLNYRRLLDRNMSCNWKYIVDKIVCNNDQQASIFLQQKLKVGTADQKFEIVQAIIDQAYPLMVNRFGNFLVQRCFEHGTPEQIISIAQSIRGNTLNLSMDAFGCHVVQKAFDCVPEEYKAIMIHELLRRIPETVIHRYACHVWQKLFELRWSDSPPQIMKYVNEALHGMWHEVALGETGSLVVQNIFENCLEEDKRPCIDEVLASIDVVAHGQFGNWCIQHICEHGSIPDRTRATEHVLRYATEYSMDQFASKVVEKCLKIGGGDFLDRYLDRVCEARPDRPRIPLIDISGDQFGNYLIQYILTNGDPERREIVAAQIRKHMVSLRGSKYGSRVAMLCCNPAFTTRPGPPAGLPLARNNSGGGFGGERFGGDYNRSFQGPSDRGYGGMGRGGYGGGAYR
ncbi:Meiotic coiled-coil protein 2 [Fulvia fulva]|uniref:Meiotic coiled-coil protein 2 n=1 Tax=Passalora fulva TaxID=5499 RepID=A0A9Q8P563_PASFU|nr:Meiotic coiled-coil protein 2 [Fulvia fulva]KAK4631140.1 Meiotic coiled-coil protein 2 [Fulvia fulva]KAK4632992.1 Meiotic coiled-coil protein 2 [Fulvia fulva]UJO13589.1 Meiotic coiled-coil protein 2 [Fulvia fulva]WPV10520.1 Meiotic coiled-coil protein 2 [Fulvia fulva]WPV25485.1 Meiotic coiled-coil protein 2 [Fulvia fulva]